MCQFNSVSGRIRLKSSNFNQVSKLDKRCSWIKVSLMLYAYQISSDSNHLKDSDHGSKEDLSNLDFSSRADTYAKDLSSNALQELQSEAQLQRTSE